MSPLTLTTSQFQIKTAKLMATFFPKPICHFHTKPPIKKASLHQVRVTLINGKQPKHPFIIAFFIQTLEIGAHRTSLQSAKICILAPINAEIHKGLFRLINYIKRLLSDFKNTQHLFNYHKHELWLSTGMSTCQIKNQFATACEIFLLVLRQKLPERVIAVFSYVQPSV